MTVIPIPEQRQHLQDAKNAVNRGTNDYARRVIFAWFARMDAAPPFQVNQCKEAQPSFCADCSSGTDPVRADFHWLQWGSLCSECSLARLDGTSEQNPRITDEVERRART